jgi:uncharacterized membrane protein YraQ (UPF0718 family)
MSFLLAASVVQVLGRSRAIMFWPLRLLGVAAYAVIAATGHPSITAIMLCESLTMACVIGLWVWAWQKSWRVISHGIPAAMDLHRNEALTSLIVSFALRHLVRGNPDEAPAESVRCVQRCSNSAAMVF